MSRLLLLALIKAWHWLVNSCWNHHALSVQGISRWCCFFGMYVYDVNNMLHKSGWRWHVKKLFSWVLISCFFFAEGKWGQEAWSSNFNWLKGLTYKLCFQVLQFSSVQLNLVFIFLHSLFFKFGDDGQCSASYFGTFPLGHQEHGCSGTEPVHLCTLPSKDLSTEIITFMQHCKL